MLHPAHPVDAQGNATAARFAEVRGASLALAEDLSEADQTVQSMPDASPTKWHLAHTTWFFETFVLARHQPGYQAYDQRFGYLFNSYYEQAGPRHPRPQRGMLTRPSAAEVVAYRRHVDEAMKGLLENAEALPQDLADLIELGLHHEQQHQELLLTDILHLLAQNPLRPAYRKAPTPTGSAGASPLDWRAYEGGVYEIGDDGEGFAFDCERPRHQVLVQPFRLATRAVTNREWLDFIADGGYRTATLWLSDGWATVNREAWQAPLYWEQRDGAWWSMTLHGMRPVEEGAPVCHVSYFEADAFARWAGKRLPTEAEWEIAAAPLPVAGNTLGRGALRPLPATDVGNDGAPAQMFGDVWEWTSSAYGAYPGFRTAEGAVGEYNGKFMCGQYVLRGGSCATSKGHIRRSYRNFFYPHQRWQFMGLRLAEDAR
jgi:ergothioneine biosynthesis protein EgtB